MTRWKRRVRIIAGASVIVTLLSGNAATAQPKVWRHGILAAKSDAGIIMMVTQGFAEKQGIKLEISQFSSDVIETKALVAGELDSFEGGPGGTMIADAHGADLKIIGCHAPGLIHGLFVRDAIETPQDLKGKTIAISAPGALPDILVRALLQQNGIGRNEVRFANLGGDTDRFKALAAGVVDAALISTEYEPIAAARGVKLLVLGSAILPKFLRICYISNGRTLSHRRADMVHFLVAEMQALHYALTHRAEALRLTRKITGMKPDDPRPEYFYDQIVRHHWFDPTLALPLDKLQWMQELSVKDGDQPALVDLGKVVASGPRDDALKLVGH